MKMTELSPDEERHLLNLSVIPALIVTYILIAFFLYFGWNQQPFSVRYCLAYFGIPFAILMPATFFLSFEILYSRKLKKPLKYCTKRFFSRVLILVAGISIFIVLSITYFALFTWIDEGQVLLFTGATWFAIWIVLFFRFREIFDKLYTGKW